MVLQESFLETRNDPYVSRRQQICNVACDVVVRGGRSAPILLPSMIVGGFGLGSVVASLRLALAIAQNGTKEQHAKLAMSGILVPISDLLRSALSNGDIYKFSSSLALVRFCGPYVAAGQGGGLESVRDAIRVATNVLTLPVNPHATRKDMETQETLKSECISALEALSRNASLWNSISTDALPSMVQYLHSSTAGGAASTNPRAEATKCAALRAVLQIVQVPSHAVLAAGAGIVEPLGRLLTVGDSSLSNNTDDEVPMLAMEVMHVIAANQQARQKAQFVERGLVRAICVAIGKAATEIPRQSSDSQVDVTFLGLEIIMFILADVDGDLPMAHLLQAPTSIAFLDSIASEPRFVQALCATFLLRTNMQIPRHDSETASDSFLPIPKLFGPPLPLGPGKCGGYESTHEAAEALLFTTAVFACAIESQRSDIFWSTLLLQNLPGKADPTECLQASAALSAHFLSSLAVDHRSFIPKNGQKQADYLSITRPLVRHRLLEMLKEAMAELSGNEANPYVTSLLIGFNVPHICLSLWRDPALLDLAFDLIKQIVDNDPDEVLHLFVEGKAAIMSLFDLLNLDEAFEGSSNVADIRKFLASILGQLGETGLLAEAVERYDVRTSAIAALAAACLSEDERPQDEDEDMTSNRLSTVLMGCLVDLITVKSKDGKEGKSIRLASGEAAAIAKSLGKKICHMVLSRFLERTKMQQYEMDDDEDITDAPDVAMLCAIAQHEEALLTLRSIGGLHALSLVAAEGEVSALVALKKACSGGADVLLEGNTYLAMMNLIDSSDHDAAWRAHSSTWRMLESSAFELLGSLCVGSIKGRNAVVAAVSCEGCVSRAMAIIISLAGIARSANQGDSTTDPAATIMDSDEEVDENEQPEMDSPPPAFSLIANKLPNREEEKEEFELGVSACGFLSSLATSKVAQTLLCGDADSVAALAHLATHSADEELQFAALKAVVAFAPCISCKGPFSAAMIGGVLKTALTMEHVKPTASMNANRFIHFAVVGLQVVIDCLAKEQQENYLITVASLFTKSVKKCIVTRATTRDEERAHAAELMYALTTGLLLARGKIFVDAIYTKDLLVMVVNFVQWRQDPKTSIGNTNQRFWDASISNALLLLSFILWRPDESLAQAGIDLRALAGNTLMLARPGKAPRKAIDVKSAMASIVNGPDAGAAVAAQRVLDRLF